MLSKQPELPVNFERLIILFSVWKAKFGIGHNSAQKFFSLSPSKTVFESVYFFIVDPTVTIDCEIGKVFMRLILWSLPNETIKEYRIRNNVDNVFDPIFPSFLDSNHPYFYNYLVIKGYPNIAIDNLDDLEDIKYMETYFYPPEIHFQLTNRQEKGELSNIIFPGIHCVYTENEWFYFDRKGIIRTKDYEDIIQTIRKICFEISGNDNCVVVLNPEDTFIVFK